MDEKERLMRRLIRLALEEDHVDFDITTSALEAYDTEALARVVAKAEGVISGTEPFRAVFLAVDRSLKVEVIKTDGTAVKPGDLIATVAGRESSILRGERTALNFLQRLSGVATTTRRYVERIGGLPVVLLDTRKTTPGMRHLEKEAVRHGGGRNHRMNLEEMSLVKENHIEMAGGISQAVSAIRSAHPGKTIEVEVKNLQELEEALQMDVGMVMLDNFDGDLARQAVERCRGRAKLELSGNVTLENVHEKAATGVDFVSAGSLTHSFSSLDISLLLERKR